MGFRALLTQRTTIERRPAGSAAASTWGDTGAAYTPVATDVPCRTWEAGQEISTAAGVLATTALKVDVPAGTDVTVQDRLVIDGRRYEVLAANPVGGGHHLVLSARGVR